MSLTTYGVVVRSSDEIQGHLLNDFSFKTPLLLFFYLFVTDGALYVDDSVISKS